MAVVTLRRYFPVVCVVGARQVGKTTLLQQSMPGAAYFDLQNRSDYERISSDPNFFLAQARRPLIIDEAQVLPELFPALRSAVDQDRATKGWVILSGSSSPRLHAQLEESLAGRIGVLELGGFGLREAYSRVRSTEKEEPRPSLAYAVEHRSFDALLSLKPTVDYPALLRFMRVGRYPEPWLGRENEKYVALWFQNYLRTYVNQDIRSLFPGLRVAAYERFIEMLAQSSGQLINYSNFARSLDVSQPTVKSYFDIAEGSFLWRRLQSYEKKVQKKRVTKMPKGHLRDSGLICRLNHIYSEAQLEGHPGVGRIWESFISELVIDGFLTSLVPLKAFHYRTHNQAEIDLILEGPFGVVPVEIKLGVRVPHQRLQTLRRFMQAQNAPFGLVINNAEETAMLAENIVQIPAGCL